MKTTQLHDFLQAEFRSINLARLKLIGLAVPALLLGRDVGLPQIAALMWACLDKRGYSNQGERVELLGRFIEEFGHGRVHPLSGDREFIGQRWVDYLLDQRIPFDLRIRSNRKLQHGGTTYHARELFADMGKRKRKVIAGHVRIYGADLRLSGGPDRGRKPGDDYCIIPSTSLPRTAHRRYGGRWSIEQLFKDSKSSGFHLQRSHITDGRAFSQLLVRVTIAYVWALRVGSALVKKRPGTQVRLKHGRPDRSVFRIGLDHLRNALINYSTRKLRTLYRFLSPT